MLRNRYTKLFGYPDNLFILIYEFNAKFAYVGIIISYKNKIHGWSNFFTWKHVIFHPLKQLNKNNGNEIQGTLGVAFLVSVELMVELL